MKKLSTFLSASLLSLVSFLSAAQNAQHDSDKTLLITLQYQYGTFEVVNTRMLNEHLPKRYTYISKHDEKHVRKGNDAIHTSEDQRVVEKVINSVNTQSKYAAHRVAGASLIVRYPYQNKAYSVLIKQKQEITEETYEMAFTESQPTNPSLSVDEYETDASGGFEKRKESTTLAEQLELSPSIQNKSGKPLYSDLI